MSSKALSAYRMYLAVKLHFLTDKYDLNEQHARVRVSQKCFEERNQEALYQKFADMFETKMEMAQYLIANFAYGAWGNTDIVYGAAEAKKNHKEWIKRKQSITQVFKNDLNKIRLEFEKNNMSSVLQDLIDDCPRIPYLFQMFIGGHITLETMVIIDSINPYLHIWKKNMDNLFNDDIRRLVKSKRFVKFDMAKVKPIFMELIQEN